MKKNKVTVITLTPEALQRLNMLASALRLRKAATIRAALHVADLEAMQAWLEQHDDLKPGRKAQKSDIAA